MKNLHSVIRKNKTKYSVCDSLEITDATNSTEGRKMRLYCREGKKCVREINEFKENFYKEVEALND